MGSRRLIMRAALWLLAWGVVAGSVGTGCAHPTYRTRGRAPARQEQTPLLPAVVAVTDFENRASFQGQWELGSGMAEILIERLMQSGQVTVVERKHIDGVLAEIMRQGRDLFRREGRVERGRLMNVRYLIRGVVTDLTVTGDASGWFGAPGASGYLRGGRTRVGLYVTVSDVETGRIVSAVRSEGTAAQRRIRGGIRYNELSFGGDAFFRTPLGRATHTAMERAVQQILRDLPQERWEPRVAESGVDWVVINGGVNVGVMAGQRFAVREEGRRITDPLTGEVIERVPGRAVGTLEIHTVQPLSARGTLIEGNASRGDFLEPL